MDDNPQPTATEEAPPAPEHGRHLGERLQEGKRTFQPGLWARLVVGGLIAVYIVAFIVLNTRHVRVRFVFATERVSLIWVILLSLAIGLVLGVVASQLHRFRSRHARKP